MAASGPDEQEASAAPDGPSEALGRARSQARARGLRPGSKPLRRSGAQPRSAERLGGASGEDGRDPHLIGEEVSGLIAERGWQVDVSAGAVMGRWARIVGPNVAAHSTPVSFELGRLVVRAETTAWATQLRLLANTLMASIETDVGAGVVTDLHIVGPSVPSWNRGPRRVSDGQGARDTYG
ncbi:MAG: DUF721 domain-containing protein [Nostocoides sp.]